MIIGGTLLIPHRLSQNDNQCSCHLRSSFLSNYSFYNQKIHLYVVGTVTNTENMTCIIILTQGLSSIVYPDEPSVTLVRTCYSQHSNTATMYWEMGVYYNVCSQVSNGAEMVMLSKEFILQHFNETIRNKLKRQVDQVHWAIYSIHYTLLLESLSFYR